MRRLRAGTRNPAPGRPRDSARAALRPLREELRWTGSLAMAFGLAKAWSAQKGMVPKPTETVRQTRKRGPGDRKAAMERREAPAFLTRECGKTEDWCATRCSIPSALPRGKRACPPKPEGRRRKTAYPAPLKNTGDGARLLAYPSPERGGSAQSAGAGSRQTETSPHPPLANARGRPPPERGRDKKDYLAV